MNIDSQILFGLRILKNRSVPGTFRSIVKGTYTPSNGSTGDTYQDYPVTVLLQSHTQFFTENELSAKDKLCIVYGKIVFTPKEGDKIILSDGTYLVWEIYKVAAKDLCIVNARKQ